MNNLIIRCTRSSDIPYFMLSRALAQDRSLSFEARGVMAYLLSKPDDWRIQPSDLEQECGKNRVYRILKELRDAGYITLNQIRDGKKIVAWEYIVHETKLLPQNQEVGFQEVENLQIENGDITYKREEQIKESSAPESAVVAPPKKKEPKPRERNLLFEAVAQQVFGIDLAELPESTDGGRIGAIAAWLAGTSDGIKRGKSRQVVGFISKPAEPKHLEQFVREYKTANPDLNLPYDLEKFVTAWRAWASTKRPRPKRLTPLPVITPVTPETRAELVSAMQEIRPAWEQSGASYE
ncbi:MAG TPA: hypothetical protein VHO69_11290 [Phototrophicaceae bacterium]|nr:hypothetical protein [Phototrophicaceae bacterium]